MKLNMVDEEQLFEEIEQISQELSQMFDTNNLLNNSFIVEEKLIDELAKCQIDNDFELRPITENSISKFSENDALEMKKNGEISNLVSIIIQRTNEQPISLSFLLFAAAIDKSKSLFRALVEKEDALDPLITHKKNLWMAKLNLEYVFETGDISSLLNNEELIEYAFKHCILLNSEKLIDYMINISKKRFLRLNVNIRIVSAMVNAWSSSSGEYSEKLRRVMKLLLHNDIVLNFDNMREEIQGTMTTDYILKCVLPKYGKIKQIEEDKEFSKR